MTDPVCADSLHHPLVTTPVLWPFDHVVVARIVDTADRFAALISGSGALCRSVGPKNALPYLGSVGRLSYVD